MKITYLFTITLLLTLVHHANAGDVNQFVQAQINQWNHITTSVIRYDVVKVIPPVNVYGEDAVNEKRKYIDNQKEMLAVYQNSGNYSPEDGTKVLDTISKMENSIDESLIIHQEVTFMTTPNKRLIKTQRLSEGTPALQTRVLNEGDSFLTVTDSGLVRSDNTNTKWFNPVLGLCRFGSDLGWWMQNGFTIIADEGRYALLDPNHQIVATISTKENENHIWNEMEILNGVYKIITNDFQTINGLPVPKTVVIQKRGADGNYIDTTLMTLLSAEVNTAVDDLLFERPNQ